MKLEYEFSLGLRWTHWIRVVMMIVLVVTGFYLTYVFASPRPSGEPTLFLHAEMRFWHLVTGFVLIGITIFKTYLFFFDRVSKVERDSFFTAINPKLAIQQVTYYLFLTKAPAYKGCYNPVQFWSYVFLYFLLYVICITGLILYVHVYHDGMAGVLYDSMRQLEVMLGGLAYVRIIHHIAMWGILIFMVAHIYFAILSTIKYKNGAMDAIFSGYKYVDDNHKH